MSALEVSAHPGAAGAVGMDRLFDAYFDSTQQMLILLDPSGTILAINRAACRQGGADMGMMIGAPFWLAPWWRDSEPAQDRLRSAVQAVAENGATIRFDLSTGPGFSAPLVFDLSITPITDAYGVTSRLMVEGRDVTEARDIEHALRTNEQRLRDIVEGSVQGIVVHRDNRVLFVNPAYADMLGYDSVLRMIGMPVDQIIPAEEVDEARQMLARLLAGEEIPLMRRLRNLRQDGTTIYVDVLARRIIWDGHYAIQATVVDVTAQAQAAAAEAARLAAEEASRTKSAFIATMSHELRTPLNAILGFAGILAADGEEDSRHVEYAEDIILAARHLLAVINDMLHLSKIEAGRLALEQCWIPLETELRQVHRITLGLAQDKRLEIRLSLPESDTPLLLHADERALRQILLNIVGNAVKFTPEGGHVDLCAVTEADGGLTIAIADTGIGIREEDMERIWRPFEQAGSRDHQNGTGLGLSIARALAELHGATVSVESRPGQGTTFRFRFPAASVRQGTLPRPINVSHPGGGEAVS